MRSGRLFLALLVLTAVLAGCVSSPTTAPVASAPNADASDSARGVSQVITGEIPTATPLMPYQKEHVFDVGPGILEVRLNFSWTSQVSDIQVRLLDPDGKDQGAGARETGTTRAMATVDPPAHGKWKLVVTSTRAVRESYSANLTLTEFIPGTSHLKEVETVGANGFRELNLIMEGNESFDYSWAIRETGATTKFNIHSHENGQTTYHVEGEFVKTNGTFTAPKRQIYSLMWENTGGLPISIDLEMNGKYRLHSHT